MALDTLSDIISEMRDWAADRPDLIGKFQDCIDLTTNDLNKVLRGPKQHAVVSLTPDENGIAALPDDYLEWRSVTSDANPRKALLPLTPEGEVDVYPNAYGGVPSHFVIEDNQITIMPANDGTITLKYWKRIPHLTQAEPVNWVLKDNANLYLFGAMKYVAIYTNNQEKLQMYGTTYAGLIDGMNRELKRAQWSRTRMRVAGRSTP